MRMSEYQKKVLNLNICKEEYKLLHSVLGLVGEAGEIAEKFKKLYRDKHGNMDEEFKIAIAKEIGDVQWYIADLCTQLGLDLNEVARDNMRELESRRDRGVLSGSGDNR